MLKTKRWGRFVADNNVDLTPAGTRLTNPADQRTMRREDRMRLVMKPFPAIRVQTTQKGHSQAPNWVKDLTLRQEDGPR